MIISVCCITLGATPLRKNNDGGAPLKGTIISFYGWGQELIMILKNKLTGIGDKDCDSVNSNTYFLSFLSLIPLNARKRYRNIIRGWQAWLTPSTPVFTAFNSQSLALLAYPSATFLVSFWRFFVDLSKNCLVRYQSPVFHKNVFKARNWWLIVRDKGLNGFFSWRFLLECLFPVLKVYFRESWSY